jgi:hypothetical protein
VSLLMLFTLHWIIGQVWKRDKSAAVAPAALLTSVKSQQTPPAPMHTSVRFAITAVLLAATAILLQVVESSSTAIGRVDGRRN